MISKVARYTFQFLLLILFQGLILNNIQLNGYINPYLYVLFILILPIETNKWVVLLLGFILGLSVDVFTSTMGMHTCATLVLAFSRVYLLRLMAPRGGYEFNATPTVSSMGVLWYLMYTSVLVFIHHLFLFYIEVFKFSQFFHTFFRLSLSFVFTLVLILIVQLFKHKPS